jgi:RHS repeat-associated protein
MTDAVEYDAFGNEIARVGTTPTEHLYRGEQFDPNLGFYYLRARWMDPSTGRFTQQDSFDGFNSDPRSLHKYLYAHADPANSLDPSGHATLADLGVSVNIQGVLSTIGQVGLRQFVRQAISATMRVARIALHEAKNCFRNPRKCKLTVPILVVGSETTQTAQHILDAQLGAGSNVINSPFWLTRRYPPHSRSWIRTTGACVGRIRGVTSCDEYPFASTEEGGAGNRARVSLRPVPVLEQATQGGLLSVFYSACRISKTRTSADPFKDKRTFIVLPTPSSLGFPLCLR